MFTHAVCSSCLGLLRSNRSAEPDLVHAFKLFYLLHHRYIQEDKSFIFMKTPQKVVPLAFSQIETIKRTVQCIERVQLLRSDVHLTLQLLTQKSKTLTLLLSPSFDFFSRQKQVNSTERTWLLCGVTHTQVYSESPLFSVFFMNQLNFPSEIRIKH